MIDVLIPVFNARETVRDALLSILRQSFGDLNVVVVDDGSTDGTHKIVADLADADPRLTIIRKENGGIVDALNVGLMHCHAEVVARHDADDIAYPHRLATQLAYLQAHPDCVAVSANAWHIDARGRRIGRTRMFGEPPADWYSAPSVEPYMMHPFLMARRAALEEAGGYRHVYNAEDSDLYWRLRQRGRLHNLSEIIGEYRVHAGSVTSGSAVNARINAATSQLAAISARRSSAGTHDLDFSADTLARYRAAGRFGDILAIAAEQLSPQETRWFRTAASAKLLELRNYRKFRLSWDDLTTIAPILALGARRMSRRDRRGVAHKIAHQVRPKLGIKRLLLRWRPPAGSGGKS